LKHSRIQIRALEEKQRPWPGENQGRAGRWGDEGSGHDQTAGLMVEGCVFGMPKRQAKQGATGQFLDFLW
jgi:hypothetical protein